MRNILFHSLGVSVLLGSGLSAAAPNPSLPEFNICYFSLNKSDEYEITKAFMNKLNANSAVKINVIEFQPDKKDVADKKDAIPNNAFKKMVESGQKCEGLVISGHHTGSYGGKRAHDKKRLEMDFMEQLSCNPKYADFFRNINAVWLEGCRTLGVGTIVPGQENNQRYDAAHHTTRVGAVLEEDQLGQSFAQLNNEFTATLDQDNPLSSRYLRLFPSAKLFGWTQTAPGEKANSQFSILFHIAHMSRIMDAQDQFPAQSPLSPTLTADSVARYVDGVLLALAKFGNEEKKCEELTTSAWIAHGSKKRETDRYAFDNADLAALTPLNSSGNEALQTMKGLECQLKEAGRTANLGKLKAVLDVVSARPELLPYAFNSLVDVRNQALKLASAEKTQEGKDKQMAVAQAILEKMRTHPTVTPFLEAKIKSPQVGVLRKIDFYKFYNAMTGQDVPEVRAEIEARILDELKKPLPRTSQTSRLLARSYRATLLQAGLKNKLLSPNVADSILALNPEWDVLEAVAKNISFFQVPDKIALLNRLATFNQGNKILAGEILNSIYLQVGKNESDRRYIDAYSRIWPRFGELDDYWHGEIHDDDGRTTEAATNPASIPAPGSLGGPPAGSAVAQGTGPRVGGPNGPAAFGGRAPVQTAPQAQPEASDPIRDFFSGLGRMFR